MNGQPLVISVSLAVLFVLLVIGIVFGGNSKQKGRKVLGQFLPLVLTSIVSSTAFFACGGMKMKAVEWVQYGFFYLAPAVVMMVVAMGALGILGMIQSKHQKSKGLFILSSLNVIMFPIILGVAWHQFG